jgi:bacterioferritin
MLDIWGYVPLGEKFRSESTDEMKHADRLIERSLCPDGHPNVQRLGTIETQLTLNDPLGATHYLAQQIRA